MLYLSIYLSDVDPIWDHEKTTRDTVKAQGYIEVPDTEKSGAVSLAYLSVEYPFSIQSHNNQPTI